MLDGMVRVRFGAKGKSQFEKKIKVKFPTLVGFRTIFS